MKTHFKWVRYVFGVLFFFSQISYAQNYYYCTQTPNNGCDDNNPPDFQWSNQRWEKCDFKYYFINGTDDIQGDDEKQAFVNAFNTWSQAVPFTFSEVFNANDADIRIHYVSSTIMSQVGASVGSPGCSYLPAHPCRGLILINDDRMFSLDADPPNGRKDLQAVALHEIGHVLGLCHSGRSEAVMYTQYSHNKRSLSQYDIAGIRSVYADVRVKNDFVNPNGSIINGGKVYIDDSEYNTEILPDKEAKKAFVPNTTHKFEAKDQLNINNKDWKFNPPSNLNGGWYQNGIKQDNSSSVFNFSVIQGPLSARFRYKTKVSLEYVTDYDGTLQLGLIGEPYQYDPLTFSLPNILTLNGARNKLIRSESSPNQSVPVTITPTADMMFTAVYKPIQRSDNQQAFAQPQNKVFRAADGSIHMVYERQGKIWYEFSTNNGATWEIGNGGTYLFSKNTGISSAKNPSIDFINFTTTDLSVVVAAQAEIGNNGVSQNCIVVSYIKRFNKQNGGYDMTEICTDGLYEYINTNESFNVNSNPGIAICNYGITNILGFHLIFTTQNNTVLRYVIGDLAVIANKVGFRFYDQSSSVYGISTDVNSTLKNSYIISSKPFGEILSQGDNYNTWVAVENVNLSTNYSKIILGRYSNTVNSLSQVSFIDNLSSGSGYEVNTKPSIIASTGLGGARVAWKGVSLDPSMPESSVIFKDADPQYTRYWNFEYNVNNVHLNRTNDRYAIIWTNNNGTVQYTDNRTLSSGNLINGLTGQGIQLSNGNTATEMRAFAFRSSQTPYIFNDMQVFATNSKINNSAIAEGRGCNLNSGSTQFYFTLGDVTVDNNLVKFPQLPERLNTNSLEKLNQYLITEAFNISDKSKFNYSIQYGAIDTLSAIKLLGKTDLIECNVELIDANNGKILKNLNSAILSSISGLSKEGINYSVNTSGIGNKAVKLRLTINTKLNFNYSLIDKYASNSVIRKANIKEIEIKLTEKINGYNLAQNYPNPFNPSTIIDYQIPNDGKVTIKVFDMLGKEIITLVDEFKTKGKYSTSFNGEKLASGLYFYEIKSGEFSESRKMVLVK